MINGRNETLWATLNGITSRNRCNSHKIDLIKTLRWCIESRCYYPTQLKNMLWQVPVICGKGEGENNTFGTRHSTRFIHRNIFR